MLPINDKCHHECQGFSQAPQLHGKHTITGCDPGGRTSNADPETCSHQSGACFLFLVNWKDSMANPLAAAQGLAVVKEHKTEFLAGGTILILAVIVILGLVSSQVRKSSTSLSGSSD